MKELYNLKWEALGTGVYDSTAGSLSGMRYLEIFWKHCKKCKKLSIHEPTFYVSKEAQRIVENVNNPLSPYWMYTIVWELCHPNQEPKTVMSIFRKHSRLWNFLLHTQLGARKMLPLRKRHHLCHLWQRRIHLQLRLHHRLWNLPVPLSIKRRAFVPESSTFT